LRSLRHYFPCTPYPCLHRRAVLRDWSLSSMAFKSAVVLADISSAFTICSTAATENAMEIRRILIFVLKYRRSHVPWTIEDYLKILTSHMAQVSPQPFGGRVQNRRVRLRGIRNLELTIPRPQCLSILWRDEATNALSNLIRLGLPVVVLQRVIVIPPFKDSESIHRGHQEVYLNDFLRIGSVQRLQCSWSCNRGLKNLTFFEPTPIRSAFPLGSNPRYLSWIRLSLLAFQDLSADDRIERGQSNEL
jgi:hypothetical protein